MSNGTIGKALSQARALVNLLEAYDETPAQHLALLQCTDNIRSSLEGSYDVATEWWNRSTELAALNVLLGIDAFDKVPTQGSITAMDLASKCNVHSSVITRVMRMLVRGGIFEENGCCVRLSSDVVESLFDLPRYLKAHKPDDIFDLEKSPFAFTAAHEGKTYYEVIDLDLKQRASWNLALQNLEKNFPILGMFPFESLEKQVKEDPHRPFIVDIGGGRGQALLKVQEHCGRSFGGKLILQDLPVVIDSINKEEIPGIDAMAYDAFTPQPVKGAHIYFMRRLLLDFYDPVASEILKNTVSAMTPDSRLVICDMLVPDRVDIGGPATLYWLDLSLLAIGGKERSLDEFKSLFVGVGLELVNVYPRKG